MAEVKETAPAGPQGGRSGTGSGAESRGRPGAGSGVRSGGRAGGWTRFVTARPRLTLLVALVITALAVLAGGGVADRMGSGGWEDPAAESTYATEALEREFPGSRPNLLLLVDTGAAGADAPAVAAEARRLADRLDAE
ncbi:MMPL family transporter, partial [Streptomyces sp. NPDC003327]